MDINNKLIERFMDNNYDLNNSKIIKFIKIFYSN